MVAELTFVAASELSHNMLQFRLRQPDCCIPCETTVPLQFADVAEPKLDPSVLVSLQQYFGWYVCRACKCRVKCSCVRALRAYFFRYSSKSKMQRLLLPHADLELSFLRGYSLRAFV